MKQTLLEHVIAGTRLEGLATKRIVVVVGDDHDPGIGMRRFYLLRRSDSVHAGQANVYENEIRPVHFVQTES